MSDPKQFENIQKVVTAILEKRAITNDDLSKFILDIVREFVDIRNSLSEMKGEYEDILQEALISLKDSVKVTVEKAEASDKKERKAIFEKLQKEVTNVENIFKEIKKIKPQKVESTPQKEKEIIREVIRENQETLKEVLLVEGDEIVDRINDLPTDDDEYKIDASHIKNLPESVGKGGVQFTGVKSLAQLLDVAVLAPQTGDVLVYDPTVGSWKSTNTYVAEQSYPNGGISFTGTTAPSGTPTHSYVWSRVGKNIHLEMTLLWAVAGTSITQASGPMPSGLPNPYIPSGLGAVSEYLASGVGGMLTATTAVPTNQGKVLIRKNAAGNGYEWVVDSASSNVKTMKININYTAAS